MGTASVLLVDNLQLVDASVQSHCPRRRGTPSKALFPVDPDVGVVVRMNMQRERLAARNVPVPVPPGADEFAWQPRVIVEKIQRCRAGDVTRTYLKIV